MINFREQNWDEKLEQRQPDWPVLKWGSRQERQLELKPAGRQGGRLA